MGAVLPRGRRTGVGTLDVAQSADPVCGLRSLAQPTVGKRRVERAACLLASAIGGRAGRIGTPFRPPAAAGAKLSRSAAAVSLARAAGGIAPVTCPGVWLHAVHDFA